MSARPPAPVGSRPASPGHLRETLFLVAGLLVVLLVLGTVDATWSDVVHIPAKALQYGALMAEGLLHSPFSAPYSSLWEQSLDLMLESVQIAWIGTMIGAAGSLPLSFLAASNTAPRWVTLPTRMLLNGIRAIPEIILAIIVMLPIFGYGNPLAGALAIGIHSIGTLGKLTSEAIEAVDQGPVDAVGATGASRLAVLRWAVLPQMLPQAIAFWLYRFEVNIRASAVLGVLGAGGVGALLSDLFRYDEWEHIGITLVVIIVVTVLIDQASAAVRHRVIHGRRGRSGSLTEAAEVAA